jgi:hypothetical protein
MSSPDMNEIGIRAWYAGVPSLAEFLSVTLIDMLLPIIFGILGYLLKRKTDHTDKDNAIFLIFISTVIIGSSILICAHIPKLVGLFVLRVARYYYLILLPFAAYYIIINIKNSLLNNYKKGALVIFLILLITPSIYTIPLRKVGKEFYWNYIEKRPPPVRGIDRIVRDRDRINSPEDFILFLEMCNWVMLNTPKSAHFLAPPAEFNSFRRYALRGLVCSFKGRGWAAFSAESARELRPLYDEVDRIFRNPACETEALIGLARREGADHIIIDKNRHDDKESWRMPFPPLFENGRYLVYKIPDNL